MKTILDPKQLQNADFYKKFWTWPENQLMRFTQFNGKHLQIEITLMLILVIDL